MSFSPSVYIGIMVDFLFSIGIAVIFRTGERKYMWRTVSDLAILRCICTIVLSVICFIGNRYPSSAMRTTYFISFYAFYLAMTGVTFKLYYEVYRKATVPFTGFARWGRMIFAWIIVAMLAMTLMNLGTSNAGQDFWARAGINMVRSIQTVEVCVAALLCFLIGSMGLPLRSKAFGIMAGLVVSSFGDILESIRLQLHLQMTGTVITLVQCSSYACFLIWIGYAFLPEPLPKPVTVPADSPVYRWSQIAAALGAKTQVAMPEPQHSFFLADVEKVVDKVFTRHMQETPESNG